MRINIPYAGGLPTGTDVTVLFDTGTANVRGIGSVAASDPVPFHGYTYYLLSLKTSHVGTLKGYVRATSDDDWVQFYQRVIPPTEAVVLRNVAVRIDQHRQVKFEWVNGGTNQTTFYVGQVLVDDTEPLVGHGYDDAAYLVNQSMAHAVTVAGGAIQVGPEGKLVALIQWANTGNPVGTLSLEFTHDGTLWKPVPGASTEFTTQPASNTGDLVCYWRELKPFKRVRLKYASASGGAANASLNAQISTW